MSRASKPAKQNGTSSAETIRASGQRPREQAGHKTAPDQHARPSQTPCNAGAIHTRHMGAYHFALLGRQRGPSLARPRGNYLFRLLQKREGADKADALTFSTSHQLTAEPGANSPA